MYDYGQSILIHFSNFELIFSTYNVAGQNSELVCKVYVVVNSIQVSNRRQTTSNSV